MKQRSFRATLVALLIAAPAGILLFAAGDRALGAEEKMVFVFLEPPAPAPVEEAPLPVAPSALAVDLQSSLRLQPQIALRRHSTLGADAGPESIEPFLTPVPEPSTGLLVASGLVALGIQRRRRPAGRG